MAKWWKKIFLNKAGKPLLPDKVFKLLLVGFVVVIFANMGSSFVVAEESDDKLQQLNKQIEEYEKQIKTLQSQAGTLSNQIKQFDAQIKLTELKISQTQETILLLGGRIDELESSLEGLTKAFSSRAIETYKMARFGDDFAFIVGSDDLSEAVTRQHYLKKIQESDHELMTRLQKAQNSYKTQKSESEDLQKTLEQQRKTLDSQKAAKAQLLAVTKNDEKKYKELLAKAKSEREAIQAIIAGRGSETEAGKVNDGQRIASVIGGASACSSGAHLHFEVAKDKAHQNPANFLSSKSVVWNNSPDGQFGFGGSWPWPLNDTIRITQGYGMTYYAGTLKYYGGAPHTGIDMVNNADYTVKAVKPGTLYRGAIGCGGGLLRYVHVKQDDGYDTYYLHVNY